MKKHTPGPWTVGQYTLTETFKSITNHSCVCDPSTKLLIAVCGPADDQQSQVDADLIAAAPEMLSLLECMSQWAKQDQPLHWQALATDDDETTFEDQILRILAKAKGGK